MKIKSDNNSSILGQKENQKSQSFLFCVENHDQAYYIWREKKVKNRTLVHIDAHMDIAWFNQYAAEDILNAKTALELENFLHSQAEYNPSPDSKCGSPDIGNYICQAVRENIVTKVFCVFPDDFLNTSRKIRYWKRYLRNVTGNIPGTPVKIEFNQGRLSTKFLNCELLLCSLATMPFLNETVLLDIDTDFFVTDFIGHDYPDQAAIHKRLPWIWPDEFIKKLKLKIANWDITTIAYSVEGYFTPLEFKWLGDYTRLLLKDSGNQNHALEAMFAAKAALIFYCQKNYLPAEKAWQNVIFLDSQAAFAYYNLAMTQYYLGDYTKAYDNYTYAVNLDQSYRTAFNNSGNILLKYGFLKHARQEFEKIRCLDPANAAAHYGLSQVLFAEKKLKQAAYTVETALKLAPDNYRALCLQGKIFAEKKIFFTAISVLEKSIAYNPTQLDAYLKLGWLYHKNRRLDDAIHCYKCVLRLGFAASFIYHALGVLYFKKRRIAKSLFFLTKAFFLFFPGIICQLQENHYTNCQKQKISANLYE